MALTSKTSVETLTAEIQAEYAALVQAAADAQYWYDQYERETQAAYEQQVAHIKAEYERQVAETQQADAQKRSAAVDTISTLTAHFGLMAASWKDMRWDNFIAGQSVANSSPDLADVPGGLRIGSMQKSVNGLSVASVEIPALLPLIGHKHILIVSRGAAKAPAQKLLQSLATRAVLTFPAGTAQFTFIDPVGLGDSFPFKDLPTSLRGEAVYTEREEIQAQLRGLTDHIRQVNQNLLGKQFETLEAYNQSAQTGGSAAKVPYRLLFIADFPTQFDSESLARLLSIAEKGPRSGVYLIAHVDSDKPLPADFKPDALMQAASVVFATPEKFSFSMASQDYDFAPDEAPDAALFRDLLTALRQKLTGAE